MRPPDPTLSFALAATMVGFAALFAPDDEAAEEPAISYTRDVRPILAENCVVCHGPDRSQLKLRLDRPDAEPGSRVRGWLTERAGYAAVVPGKPEESELLARLTDEDDEWRMPPAEHAGRLSAADIATLEGWIREGAPYEEHWAYAPLAEEPGELAGTHPIDGFVRARLAEQGLELQPEAAPRALLRRVALDLTGLPPTPDELDSFLEDEQPAAYERAVERLLASDAYAEHWTRAWLDLARYADSHGYTIDGARSIWPWRDWVLRAIKEDIPYDEFTVRQLAGDLLPDATNADRVATGFQRNTQINQEGGAKDEENRVNAVHDRVATTGAVWLGTTLACAQCHDHKFDPIKQRDYYRMFAFYNTTVDGGVTGGPAVLVAETTEEEAAVLEYESRVAQVASELRGASEAAAAGWTTWRPRATRTDNGPELVPKEDGSYLAVGQNPVTTTYELTGEVPAEGVQALRLEVLPDGSLPGRGPGRARAGAFVLTAVQIEVRSGTEGAWTAVPVESARADFEQDTRASGGVLFGAADVLAGGTKAGGWAINPLFGEPHVLHLRLENALAASSAQDATAPQLRIILEQRFGRNHTLGRFRVRTTASEVDAPPRVSPSWRAAFLNALRVAKERPQLAQSLVLRERWEPRETHIFRRGSFLDPGERVEAGIPSALAHLGGPAGSGPTEASLGGTRLDLARWLVHPENALTLRVTVNRWWQAFFGRGLVATENDFGLRGASPSHPVLLDWLAREFALSGFSRKHMHRRIVTSATYRQRAPEHGALAERDPDNTLLARQRRLRLEPEAIRDAALVASGLLAPRFGGPPVQPPQPAGIFAFTQNKKDWQVAEGPDRYRRTLYTRRWRSALYPFLATFDAPPATVTCTRRERTNSPLQALTLANDPMLHELAAALGARARAESGSGSAGLGRAFELALGRSAEAEELALLAAHFELVRAGRSESGADEESAESAALTAIGRVLFNLDEFSRRP